jgi:glycine dehydrogenase
MTAFENLQTSFADRHIGTTPADQQAMLDVVGQPSLDALVRAAIPESIHVGPVADSVIPAAVGETEALAELRAKAGRNTVRRAMIGLGYHGTHTPAVIQRNVLENPSWYTAYTPYQPEISQGRLEALINFQTMVSDLTGMATAGASMLDEGTAVVEGMLLARRASKVKGDAFLVDADLLPQTRALLDHRADAVGITLRAFDAAAGPSDDQLDGAFGVILQYPGASGRIVDPSSVIERVHSGGGWRAGCRRGRRDEPALRRPARLRWPARRLPRGARRPRASAPRSPGRGVLRRRRPDGLPPQPADPRTAHPP